MTDSNARTVFTRRAHTVGNSVRTTFGRRKNTEAIHDIRVVRSIEIVVREYDGDVSKIWKKWNLQLCQGNISSRLRARALREKSPS